MIEHHDALSPTPIAVGPHAASHHHGVTLVDGAAFFPHSVASGDPRPDSVILWTRVSDPHASGDLEVELQVALDHGFERRIQLEHGKARLKALARHDHCVKARLTGLEPSTFYYYRFVYEKHGAHHTTRVGRTKTAPPPGADVAVKFAYVSCQDYIGRYFNPYLLLAAEDLDFVVHLGDYVYETTGDPAVPNATGRSLRFTDQASAIQLGEGEHVQYAARSLGNYRQLYRMVRSDRNLQAVHERFPMIATWDDHEFADDCHGDTATYFDGRRDETDPERRRAANQAWLEYQPADCHGPAAGARIHRDFVFGKNVHLVVTDLRSERADHVIPEDALPGAVVLDQATLTAALGQVPDGAAPYIDVAAYQGGAYQQALVAAAPAAGFDPAKVTGKISVPFVNEVVAEINATRSAEQQIPSIDPADPSLERGFAYLHVGKLSFYGSMGARYMVVKDTFDLIAGLGYQASDGASEEVMGKEQEAWFLRTIQGSSAVWKVWANEYCLTQMAIDLTKAPVPDEFKQRFYLNVDAWDGFRDKRSELLQALSGVGGVVAITGDIHGFYAATPMANEDPAKKIVEIVGGSITSTTFQAELRGQVQNDPMLSQLPGHELISEGIDALMLDRETRINPHLAFANSSANGYVTVEAKAGDLVATLHMIPESEVSKEYTEATRAELLSLVKTARFRAVRGENELYRDEGGVWTKWDPATQTWTREARQQA
jgi:alkaline phosphatase D